MSTRSVIAVPTPDGGWRGRYCHSDGYPDHQERRLYEILSRHGYAEAVRVLTEEHGAWLYLAKPDEDLDRIVGGNPDGRVAVPGYGIAMVESEPEDWYTSDGDRGGCQYAYVLTPDGVVALEWSHETGAWVPSTEAL